MRRGWPDITGIWDGKPLFIEVKRADKGQLSVDQYNLLQEASKKGAITIVASKLEDVLQVLNPN